MKQLGLSRKKIGKLHKEYYVKRLEKARDIDAFQKAIMATIKAMMDVMDANNKQLTADIRNLLEKKYPELVAQMDSQPNAEMQFNTTVDDEEPEPKFKDYKDYYERQDLR